jgi:hypothetical protein
MNEEVVRASHDSHAQAMLYSAHIALQAIKAMVENDRGPMGHDDPELAAKYDSAVKLIDVLNRQLDEIKQHIGAKYN